MSETMYSMDAAMPSRMHSGHVEHDELEISDDELRRLKKRAAKAVTMDEAEPERAIPEDYRSFLGGGVEQRDGHDAFLRGEH